MTTSYRTDADETPDELKRRREFAELLMMSGMKQRPIEHWTQGLAQLMQAGVGGWMSHKAGEREGELRAAGAERSSAALAAALAGETPDVSALSDPWAPPGVNKVLAGALSERLKPYKPKYEFNPITGAVVDMNNPGAVGEAPNVPNPHFTGKQTDAQASAAGRSGRGANALNILNEIGDPSANESTVSTVARVLPDEGLLGGLKRSASDPDRKRFDNAADEFINAINGRPSGTPVTPAQREEAARQFIPQPGDGPELRQQKAEAARIALEGVFGQAGPNFAPPEIKPFNQYNDEGSSWSQNPTQGAPTPIPVPTMAVTQDGSMTPTQGAGMAPPARLPNGMTDGAPQPTPEHLQKLKALLSQYPDPKDQAEIMAEWESKYPQYGRGSADHFLGRDVQAGR